jgi:hypothetical protein
MISIRREYRTYKWFKPNRVNYGCDIDDVDADLERPENKCSTYEESEEEVEEVDEETPLVKLATKM